MGRGRPRVKLDIKDLITDYLSGMSLMDLAGKYGVSDMTIHNRLKATGIPTRPPHRRLKKEGKVRVKDPLNDKEFIERVTMYKSECGFNDYQISHYMQTSVKDIMMVTRRKSN
jgi:hypothetical protein